jgi:cell division protein FtsL
MQKTRRTEAKRSRKKEQKARANGRKGLDFGFFIFVCIVLAGTGIFILVQHQLAVSSELKRLKIEDKITAEKTKEETLKIQLAKLKSPDRILRIAQDELGMVAPYSIIYLRYKREANGKVICRSSYERRSQEANTNGTGYQPVTPGQEQGRSITQR